MLFTFKNSSLYWNETFKTNFNKIFIWNVCQSRSYQRKESQGGHVISRTVKGSGHAVMNGSTVIHTLCYCFTTKHSIICLCLELYIVSMTYCCIPQNVQCTQVWFIVNYMHVAGMCVCAHASVTVLSLLCTCLQILYVLGCEIDWIMYVWAVSIRKVKYT